MRKLPLICCLFLWSCQSGPTGIEEGEWYVVREPSGDVHFSAIHFADRNHGWAVGDSGTVLHTGDGGDTWEYQQSGTPNSLRDVYFVDSRAGWAAGYNNTIIHTTDGGKSWESQSIISDTAKIYTAIHFADEQSGWTVHNYGEILHTDDAGVSWEVQTSWELLGTASLSFINKEVGFAIPGRGHVFLRTIDGGANWEFIPMQIPMSPTDLCFTDEKHGWISTLTAFSSEAIDSAPVFYTSDGGQTWVCQDSLPDQFLTSIHFIDNQLGWVSAGSNIFHTADGGNTWGYQIESQVEGIFFKDIYFVDDSHGWVLDYQGAIYKYTVP